MAQLHQNVLCTAYALTLTWYLTFSLSKTPHPSVKYPKRYLDVQTPCKSTFPRYRKLHVNQNDLEANKPSISACLPQFFPHYTVLDLNSIINYLTSMVTVSSFPWPHVETTHHSQGNRTTPPSSPREPYSEPSSSVQRPFLTIQSQIRLIYFQGGLSRKPAAS